jgi:hypothetical protein
MVGRDAFLEQNGKKAQLVEDEETEGESSRL